MAISEADLEELSSMAMMLPRHACDKLRELAAALAFGEVSLTAMRAQRDEEKARRENCGQDGVCAIAPGCDRHWAERNAELCAQRDEARELVRRYVEGDCLYEVQRLLSGVSLPAGELDACARAGCPTAASPASSPPPRSTG